MGTTKVARNARLRDIFDEIEFECGYYPRTWSGESIFESLNESDIDLTRVINEIVQEITNDVNIVHEYKTKIIELLESEL